MQNRLSLPRCQGTDALGCLLTHHGLQAVSARCMRSMCLALGVQPGFLPQSDRLHMTTY